MRQQMQWLATWVVVVVAAATGFPRPAAATIVPFTEDFAVDEAGWEDTNNDPLTFVASGGPDGSSHVSTTYNYFGFSSPFGGGPVVFRATGSDAASGGAFIGDWLADGVGVVSLWMRHDATEALTPFLRVAGPANFPGAVLPGTTAILPNVWTQVFFAVDLGAPSCIPEGTTCAAVFASVSNLQFGTDAPAGLAATDQAFQLDLDQVSLVAVPEPGTALLVALGLVGLQGWSRRSA